MSIRIIAAASIAAGMLLGGSGLAQADPDPDPDISTISSSTTPAATNTGYSTIRSIVYWTGPYCIPIRAPQYPNGNHTMTKIFCGGYSEGNYIAYPGEFVGADPAPSDTTTSLGCELYIDGFLDNRDYAPPSDKHNVNCLRILVGYGSGPGSAQSQV